MFSYLPKKADGIPYITFTRFNIKINDFNFQIEADNKFLYFPAVKISVESENEIEAKNQLEKILKKYIK